MTKVKSKKSFSTLGFILVNIGCAVGLGNIWRFPRDLVANGGSSYIIIYLIMLVLIAFPIILLEMQYGLFYRRSAVGCFEKVAKKPGRFIGWMQIIGTGTLCFYYLAVVSWVLCSLAFAVVPSFFQQMGTDSSFFQDKILHSQTTINTTEGNIPGGFALDFSPWIMIGGIVLILAACFVIFLGVKGLEKVNMILVPALFLLLIFLLVYALTLKNSAFGLNTLFQFKQKQFLKPLVWYSALKQAIFSTGIMFGTFIVFSKNSNIKIDKGNDAIIVICADTLIGIMSGVIIVSVISYNYGQKLGTDNETLITKEMTAFFADKDKSTSTTLAFTVLPTLFLAMNNGASFGIGNALFIFFLLALLFAAFSSLIGLLEVFSDSLSENFPQMNRNRSLIYWGFFATIMLGFYSSSIGSQLVGEQDSALLLIATITGLAELILFVNHRNFRKVMRENQKHSYLKLSPQIVAGRKPLHFNWFVFVCRFIVTPIVFVLVLYGLLEFFGADYYLTRLIPETDIEFLQNIKKDTKILELTMPKMISWNIIIGLLASTLFFTFNTKSSVVDSVPVSSPQA